MQDGDFHWIQDGGRVDRKICSKSLSGCLWHAASRRCRHTACACSRSGSRIGAECQQGVRLRSDWSPRQAITINLVLLNQRRREHSLHLNRRRRGDGEDATETDAAGLGHRCAWMAGDKNH